MAETLPPSCKSNATIIWEAITELTNAGRLISRQVLRDLTGLKITIIDDHVERLDENGKIRRIGSGLIEVVEVYPPARAISVTETESGWVTAEMGDLVWQMQPKEARKLARLLMGYSTQLEELEGSHSALLRTTELANQVRELRTQITRMQRSAQAQNQQQMPLAMGS